MKFFLIHGLLFFSCVTAIIPDGAAQNKSLSQQQWLDSITLLIRNGKYTGIDAVLISHKGKTVYEQYFNGFHKDSLHDSRSSFKSITALLTGIAIDKGYIKSDQEKVYPFFSDYGSKIHPATFRDFFYREQMTIRHLLEMRSGFNCEEFYGTQDCESAMSASKDWIRYSLQLPMATQPGRKWSYSSSNSMLLGGIIARASRMPLTDFAAKFLFQPLGIQHYRWTKDPSGNAMTAGSFFILPFDMMKIGQLVASRGKWKDQQLISANWIHTVTRPIESIDSFSFVRSSRTIAGKPQPTYYGYAWYTEKLVNDPINETVVFASGNGGQYIMIIERLQLVLVFTGSNYNNFRSKYPFEIILKYILPAFTSPKAT